MDEHKMGADEDLRTIQFPWRLYPAWFWTRMHADRLPLFPHASHLQTHGFSSTLWIGLVPPTAAKGWWNVLRSVRIILLNHHHTYIAARHMRRLLIMLQREEGSGARSAVNTNMQLQRRSGYCNLPSWGCSLPHVSSDSYCATSTHVLSKAHVLFFYSLLV